MSSVSPPTSSSTPEASSSSTAPARACIWAILSCARAMSAPVSPEVVEIPDTVSFTEVCACAAVYWAFSTSFCVRKLLTRFCSASSVCESFCSCSASS